MAIEIKIKKGLNLRFRKRCVMVYRDIKPTYRDRGGVEVTSYPYNPLWYIKVILYGKSD